VVLLSLHLRCGKYRIRAVKLRWIKTRTWSASLRSGVPERFEDRVTGRIVYSLRLVKTTNCSLCARLLRLVCGRPLCIRAHERGKVCCPFSQEEYAYIVFREARRGNINASSLNLIFCFMLYRSYDKTIDIILRHNLHDAFFTRTKIF